MADMPRNRGSFLVVAALSLGLAVGLLSIGGDHGVAFPEIAAASAAATDTGKAALRITYPAEGTLFPPESVAPTFLWEDGTGSGGRWDVVVRDDAGVEILRDSVDGPRWR